MAETTVHTVRAIAITSSPHTFNIPNVANGDYLLLLVGHRTNSGSGSLATLSSQTGGWSILAERSAATYKSRVWGKRVSNATNDSNSTVTLTFPNLNQSSNTGIVYMVRVRNSSPFVKFRATSEISGFTNATQADGTIAQTVVSPKGALATLKFMSRLVEQGYGLEHFSADGTPINVPMQLNTGGTNLGHGRSQRLVATTVPTNEVEVPDDPEELITEPPPPPPSAPSAPTNLKITSRSSNSLRLEWDHPGGAIDNWTSRLMRNDGSTLQTSTHNGRVRDFSSLPSNTSFRAQVRSNGPGGSSSFSTINTSTSSAPPPPSLTTYTREYPATWSQSYRSNGSQSWTNAFQGHWGGSDHRSLLGFNDSRIRSDLSGAEILSVEFVFYIMQDGAARNRLLRLGYHNRANRPGSWNSSHVTIMGGYGLFMEGSYHRQNMGTTLGVRFQQGVARGIAIGPAGTADILLRTVVAGAKDSRPPRLVIRYRK